MVEERCIITLFIGIIAIVTVLVVVLVPMSYSYLEYYEYGFVRQKSTGKVDSTKVYEGGKYFLGPDYEFKTFRSDAHNVKLDRISAVTKDRLEVHVSAYFQYFLRKDELYLLHASYDIYYEEIMENKASDAVKTAFAELDKDDVFFNRSKVESHLFNAVRQRLGGICCTKDCDKKAQGCLPDCKASECTDTDKVAFVEVRFFQLTYLEIPETVGDMRMKQLLQEELLLKEEFTQKAQIERSITEKQVRDIKNEADEMHQSAIIQSEAIKKTTEAAYFRSIESAISEGLKTAFTIIDRYAYNRTTRSSDFSQEQKNSFVFLRTLRESDNVHLTVDFQQRIVGNH